MSETTTEQETRYPNREEQIRSVLDRLIDRAKEDVFYVSMNLQKSEKSTYYLRCANQWSRILINDAINIRDQIKDLKGEIDE